MNRLPFENLPAITHSLLSIYQNIMLCYARLHGEKMKFYSENIHIWLKVLVIYDCKLNTKIKSQGQISELLRIRNGLQLVISRRSSIVGPLEQAAWASPWYTKPWCMKNVLTAFLRSYALHSLVPFLFLFVKWWYCVRTALTLEKGNSRPLLLQMSQFKLSLSIEKCF